MSTNGESKSTLVTRFKLSKVSVRSESTGIWIRYYVFSLILAYIANIHGNKQTKVILAKVSINN